MTAAEIPKGIIAQITQFSDHLLAVKLLSMGIVPGASITLVRKGFGNGNFYFKINGTRYALRKAEAASIHLKSEILPNELSDTPVENTPLEITPS